MAFGFGVLRLSPRHFWAMTPRELYFAVEGRFGKQAGAPDRAVLAQLMRAFPD